MGDLPYLEDEAGWFLAMDFDESDWSDDVDAFMETCTLAGLPAAVEIFRSESSLTSRGSKESPPA